MRWHCFFSYKWEKLSTILRSLPQKRWKVIWDKQASTPYWLRAQNIGLHWLDDHGFYSCPSKSWGLSCLNLFLSNTKLIEFSRKNKQAVVYKAPGTVSMLRESWSYKFEMTPRLIRQKQASICCYIYLTLQNSSRQGWQQGHQQCATNSPSICPSTRITLPHHPCRA